MHDLSTTRRAFLANAGTVVGLAAATVPTVAAVAKYSSPEVRDR